MRRTCPHRLAPSRIRMMWMEEEEDEAWENKADHLNRGKRNGWDSGGKLLAKWLDCGVGEGEAVDGKGDVADRNTADVLKR